MSRINLVPLDLAEPKALVEAIRHRRGGQLSNLDRLLLNSPALAEGWNSFLGTVRQKLSLTPKVREIVMCSVAVLNKAEYEFFHHVREFEKAGGTPEQIEAMRDVSAAAQNSALFDLQEQHAFQLTLEMTRDICVSESTMASAKKSFTNQELTDLIATIAAYNMVSRVVVACDIRPEHKMQKQSAVIVGTGLMGCDIIAIFLNAGWKVQAVEPGLGPRQAAPARAQVAVQQLKGQWNDSLLSVVPTVKDIQWGGVAIVVETVTENLAIKQTVFRELDQLVPLDIPIGSNSSGLRITDISADCKTASRMANAHFFLPAHLVPLVELAKGESTSDETMDQLQAIFRAVGRVTARINKDLPGLLANRIQHAMMREAFAIIESGLATPEDVDAAVRYGFGFRYVAAGPILQKELAGLETQLAAATAIYPSLCNDPEPSQGLKKLVAEGRFGTKSLAGFWDWTAEEVKAERKRYEAALGAAADVLLASPARFPSRH